MAVETVEKVSVEKQGEFVTLRHAANSIRVNPNTLYKWMCREGKSFRMIGRTLLVRMDEVRDYEQYRSR